MKKIRVAINGFGRIGRLAFRQFMANEEVEVVAFNDLAQLDMLVHLLRYDTAQGSLPYEVKMISENEIKVDGQTIQVFQERNPVDLPWGSLDIDVVLESTGVFLTREKASLHLQAGAKRVVLSAPAKGGDIPTYVLGVNADQLKASDEIISNASCTTNCLAPMAKVIDSQFGLTHGFITTIHAYTSSQMLQDAPHKDFRRARAAAENLIPTSTGAAKAVGLVLPQLNGKLDGMAVRVPIITGSITDCTFTLDREVTATQVNQAMKEAADGPMNGVLKYCEDPIVSSDIIGDSHSCIFDAELTSVKGNLLKMSGWYDNEFGYASRVAEMVAKVGILATAQVSA